MGEKGEKIIKSAAFLAGLLLLWLAAEYVLSPLRNWDYDTNSLSYIHENEDLYDVIFLGNSMALTNVSSEELYLEYGISAASVGAGNQPVYLSYYSLAETFLHQSPKAVFLETGPLFYSEEKQTELLEDNEFTHLYITLAGIGDKKLRYQAFSQAQELYAGLDVWDYFSVMYYSHGLWESLDEENFTRQGNKDHINGNLLLYTAKANQERETAVADVENTGEAAVIPELNREYLEKIASLCEENGAELILLNSSPQLDWSWDEYNAAEEIAEEYGLAYLDVNLAEEEAGLDWRLHIAGASHFNVCGARAWTDYLGTYLRERYDLADRRTDADYPSFEGDEEHWQDALEAMEAKTALLSASDFNSVLETLAGLDREDNVLLFAVEREAAGALSSAAADRLMALFGMQKSLAGKEGYSYLYLLDANIREEKQSRGVVSLEGTFENGVEYSLQSGGKYSGADVSITIGGEEQASGKRGIHIVVYNKAVDEVLYSVYFDTHASGDPPVRRVVSGTVQRQTGINTWEAE